MAKWAKDKEAELLKYKKNLIAEEEDSVGLYAEIEQLKYQIGSMEQNIGLVKGQISRQLADQQRRIINAIESCTATEIYDSKI